MVAANDPSLARQTAGSEDLLVDCRTITFTSEDGETDNCNYIQTGQGFYQELECCKCTRYDNKGHPIQRYRYTVGWWSSGNAGSKCNHYKTKALGSDSKPFYDSC